MFQHGNFIDVGHSNCQKNKTRKKVIEQHKLL